MHKCTKATTVAFRSRRPDVLAQTTRYAQSTLSVLKRILYSLAVLSLVEQNGTSPGFRV
jgi:hypothetical protein